MTSFESQQAFLEMVRDGPGHMSICTQTGEWSEIWLASNEEITNFADQYWSSCDLYVAPQTFYADPTSRQVGEESQLRALWVQVDGQDGFCRKTAARIIAELQDVIKRNGLPSPNIHHSTGEGVDFYWAFKQPVSLKQWQSLAENLYYLLMDCGVRVSPNVPESGQFLRLPGTRNFRHRDDPFDTELTIITDELIPVEVLQKAMDQTMMKYDDNLHYGEQQPINEPQDVLDCHGSQARRSKGLITKAASTYSPTPVEWLIDQSVPLGNLVVIAGEPGLGKSQIAIRLAAAVSTGQGLPDGQIFNNPGSAIILANEDDADRTIRPRLEAAGANLDRVHIVEGVARSGQTVEHFQLASDIGELAAAAKRIGDVRLIVIDPPSAYLGQKTDANKDQDVRGVLVPLTTLAQETGCLILLIVHLNKRTEGSAQQRIGGSTAWTAAPRAAFMAVEDSKAGKRYLVPVKNNLGNDRTGFEYQVVEKILSYAAVSVTTSYIEWRGTTNLRAEELLGKSQTSGRTAIDSASEFLEEKLRLNAHPVEAIYKMAAEADISEAALERAKRKVGVVSTKKGQRWHWSLPQNQGEAGMGSGRTVETAYEARF